MEICNSYYLISNNEDQQSCIKWLKNFFNVNTVKEEKKEGTLVVDLSTTPRWIGFTWVYKDKNYKVFYKTYFGNAKNKKDAGFYLDIKIEYKKNKRKYADVLSSIIQELKTRKKNDFYLVVLSDELSRYFTEISYKSLSIYERKLRQLLLVITTPMDGKDWSDNFKSNKVNLNSKEKNNIERGLEELDLSDFEALFFKPVVNFDEYNYNSKFSMEKIEQLSKDEIIEMIKNNKPDSFWDRYIQKYIKINNMDLRMENIRNQRNKIAHNKYLSSEDQKKFIKDVKYVSEKIDEAIEEIIIHKEKFDIEIMNNILGSFKKLVEYIVKQYSDYSFKPDYKIFYNDTLSKSVMKAAQKLKLDEDNRES